MSNVIFASWSSGQPIKLANRSHEVLDQGDLSKIRNALQVCKTLSSEAAHILILMEKVERIADSISNVAVRNDARTALHKARKRLIKALGEIVGMLNERTPGQSAFDQSRPATTT